MELRTPRLILRPAALADLHTTFAYAGDPGNTRFMMFLPYRDLAETAEYLRACQEEWQKDQPDLYEFAVCLGGSHIGSVTLYMQEDRTEAELGWILHRDHWRRGYITEAAEAVMEFARTIGVRRVFACCDSENVPSYKTMEKLGMRLVKDDGVRQNRSMGDEIRRELTYACTL